MEYIKGDNIDNLEVLREKYGDTDKITDTLIEIYSQMIFKNGFIHCDAHAGNIFVRPHPKDAKKP
jgi:aarF domain-containing kinase